MPRAERIRDLHRTKDHGGCVWKSTGGRGAFIVCELGWGRRCVVRGLGVPGEHCPPPRAEGCSGLGALLGAGIAAIPTSEGFLSPQSPYFRFNGAEGLRDLGICIWVRGCRVPGVQQEGVNV